MYGFVPGQIAGFTHEDQMLTAVLAIGMMVALGVTALAGDEAIGSILANGFVGVLAVTGLGRYYRWRKET